MLVTIENFKTPATISATISNNPQACIARSCKLPTSIRPWTLRFDVKYFYEERITIAILNDAILDSILQQYDVIAI